RVLPTDSLDDALAAALFRVRGPLYVPLDQTTRDEQRIRELTFAGRDVRNLRPSADSMRLVKDADEIARMRKAVDISVLGHVAAMQAARPGVWEYEIEAVLEAAFRRNGADRVGYPSIVGSGPNSTTLHYDVSRRRAHRGRRAGHRDRVGVALRQSAEDHGRDRAPDGAALALVFLAFDVCEDLFGFLLVFVVQHVSDREPLDRRELLPRLGVFADVDVHLAQLEPVENVLRLQGDGLLEVLLRVLPVALVE